MATSPVPARPLAPAPVYFSTSFPKKSHTGRNIGLILLVIIILAVVAGGGAYASASSAVASLEPTCMSSSDSVNWIGLTIALLTSFTPDTVLGTNLVEYGIHNPSSTTVNSNWIMQRSWVGASVSDTQAFTVPAGTTQYVTFHLPITVTTGIQILIHGLNTASTTSLTRDDSAFGFHFTNQITTSGATSSNPGPNPDASATSNLPSC